MLMLKFSTSSKTSNQVCLAAQKSVNVITNVSTKPRNVTSALKTNTAEGDAIGLETKRKSSGREPQMPMVNKMEVQQHLQKIAKMTKSWIFKGLVL
ncbi:hypothetical protein BC332_18291 [Capsicum chinense]|nr:hypothetical protein BC332_18291 [Capsicum chinense]